MADSSEAVLSWDVPPLPMISFDLKDSQPATFANIKPFIESQYGEDGNSYNEEIRQMDQLRSKAAKPSRDHSGVSLLRRYSGQLCLLKARFTRESDFSAIPIEFRWKDVYSGTAYQAEGFYLEQASVLYNMGALHSQLGARETRGSEQEMKEACTHFQCAAGAFTYLVDNFGANHCKDMSPELINMYKTLMLGQAQECLIEKSTKGEQKPKPVIVAKLASKASEMFSFVLTVLESDAGALAAKKHKDWVKLCQAKSQFYIAVSHFFQAESCAENGRFGEKIAYLQSVNQTLKDMSKSVKGLPEPMKQALKYFQESAQARLKAATQLNESVYHDLIPGIDSLEPVQPVELVKPIIFKPTDPSCVGTDIFSRLVPMRAYEAASVFSEEKAKLLRSVTSSVEEANDTLQQYMQALRIEELQNVSKGPPPLPAEIVQYHNVMAGKSVPSLKADLNELLELQEKVTKDLAMLEKHRKESVGLGEGEEGEALEAVLTSCWKDLDRNSGFHQQAANSNLELKQLFDKHKQNFITLQGSLAAIQASVPTMTLMDSPEISGSDAQRLSEVLKKVDEMKVQRKTLLLQLRNNMSKDEIIRPLIAESESSQESLFEEHMQKHKDLAALVRQNLTAQENILTALTEINAKHAYVREAAVTLTARQQDMFQSLISAGDVYPVIEGKIREGLSFYQKLAGNVGKLLKRVEDALKQYRLLIGGGEGEEEEEGAANQQQSKIETGQPILPGGVPPPRPPKREEFRGDPLDGLSNPVTSSLPRVSPSPLPPVSPGSLPGQNIGEGSIPSLLGSLQANTALSLGRTSPNAFSRDLTSDVTSDVLKGETGEFSNTGSSLLESLSLNPPTMGSSEQLLSSLGSLFQPPAGVPTDQNNFSLNVPSSKSPLASINITGSDGGNSGSEIGDMGTGLGMQNLQLPGTLPTIHKLDESTGEEIGSPSVSTSLRLPSVSSTGFSDGSVFGVEPSPHLTLGSGLPSVPHSTPEVSAVEPSDVRSDLASLHSSSRISLASDNTQPDVSSMPWMQTSPFSQVEPPPSSQPEPPPSQFQPPPSSHPEPPSSQFQPPTLSQPEPPPLSQPEPPPSSEAERPTSQLELGPPQFQSQVLPIDPQASLFQPPSSESERLPSLFQPPSSQPQPPPSQSQPPPSQPQPPPSQPQPPPSQPQPPPSHGETLPPQFQSPLSQMLDSTSVSSVRPSFVDQESVQMFKPDLTEPSVSEGNMSSLSTQLHSLDQSLTPIPTSSGTLLPSTHNIGADLALLKQYEMFQQQAAQVNEQKEIIESMRRQLEQQTKDKAESTSNYQSILSLLQQQQPMIQQQQSFIHQLQEQNEIQRRKVHEIQMKYEQRLSQEVLARERLQNQAAQLLEESQRRQKTLSQELHDTQKKLEAEQKDHISKEKELVETKSSLEHFLHQRTQESQQLQSRLQEAMSQSHHQQQYVQQCQNELQDRMRTIDGLQSQQQQHFSLEQEWNAKEQRYSQEVKQLRERLGELQAADRRHKDEIHDLKNQIGDLTVQLKSSLMKPRDEEASRRSPSPPPPPPSSSLNHLSAGSELPSSIASSPLDPINVPSIQSVFQSQQQTTNSLQQPQAQPQPQQQQQQQPTQQPQQQSQLQQPGPQQQQQLHLQQQHQQQQKQQQQQQEPQLMRGPPMQGMTSLPPSQESVMPKGQQSTAGTQLSHSAQFPLGQQPVPLQPPLGQQLTRMNTPPGGQQLMNMPRGQLSLQPTPQQLSALQQQFPHSLQPGQQPGVLPVRLPAGQQLAMGGPAAQLQQQLWAQQQQQLAGGGIRGSLQSQRVNQPGLPQPLQPSIKPPALMDSNVSATVPMSSPLVPTPTGPKPNLSMMSQSPVPLSATKPVMTPIVTQSFPGGLPGQPMFTSPVRPVQSRPIIPGSMGTSLQSFPAQGGMNQFQLAQQQPGAPGLQPSGQLQGQFFPGQQQMRPPTS